MTYYEAALEILDSTRHPLSTQEITHLALKRGLVVPRGTTPQATMAAVLYRRLASDTRLVKIDTPGKGRAIRGSVRWALRTQ